MDAADVLEVTDLANAIARAEEVIRARSSHALNASPSSSGESGVPDMFDRLLATGPFADAATNEARAAQNEKTDDIAGSAVYAPYRPTPVPPPVNHLAAPSGKTTLSFGGLSPDGTHPLPALHPSTLMQTPLPLPPPYNSRDLDKRSADIAADVAPAPATQTPAPAPSASSLPPAARTAPILILDEDAFYHPAGRIRGFADVTLESYRPEPTVMVRLRQRRSTLAWVVIAVLVPLALFALFVLSVTVGSRVSVSEPAATAATARTVQPAQPRVEKAPAAAATPAPAPSPTVVTSSSPVVPVFDVNNLPPVKGGASKRH